MLASEQKKAAITGLATHKTDTGSSAVQASILTQNILSLTEHVKANKHDFMSRRGLLQMVGKRRRLLKYLADNDPKQYLEVIKKLGLRH
jgi:small subunit ribosomal protein S15